jgi:oxygen-independent coproporphyrinogen-3 oxidase
MILQLKTGRLDTAYFQRKFGANVIEEFKAGFDHLEGEGFLIRHNGTVGLTRTGLLQIDRHLPVFFEPEHRGARYT